MGLYLSTENRISISEPLANRPDPHRAPPFSPVRVSARSFYPGTHKDVQDFPRILLRKSPGSASAVRSSEHRGAGWLKAEDEGLTGKGSKKIIAGYQSRDPTSRARYIFRLLLPYWSFHRFEEDGYFASTLVDPH